MANPRAPTDPDLDDRDLDEPDAEQPGSQKRRTDADPAFSPAAEEGAAALSNIGTHRASELFRKDED